MRKAEQEIASTKSNISALLRLSGFIRRLSLPTTPLLPTRKGSTGPGKRPFERTDPPWNQINLLDLIPGLRRTGGLETHFSEDCIGAGLIQRGLFRRCTRIGFVGNAGDGSITVRLEEAGGEYHYSR